MSSIYKRNEKLYITSGEYLLVLNTLSGIDKQITIPELNRNEINSKQLKESRQITALAFSKCGEYLAVATENKWVLIYDKSFQIIKSFVINRTANKLLFTSVNSILVADKSGDVYLHEETNNNKGLLLLGHRSVILDMILTSCGKYIITCDRDEKIRVSCYPNCYNIVSFCLGHSEFVTRLKLLTNEVLLSASGDGTVRFWNFKEGIELNAIDTNTFVDDKELLQKFASRFEKTEIFALPISDMDIHFQGEYYLAVSIYGCNLIQLYTIYSHNLSFTYLTKFFIEEPFYYFLDDHLYTLSKQISAFSYVSSNYSNLNLEILEKFSKKYGNLLQHSDDNSISVLYKRKFDNVQEYMERKKIRTEIK